MDCAFMMMCICMRCEPNMVIVQVNALNVCKIDMHNINNIII